MAEKVHRMEIVPSFGALCCKINRRSSLSRCYCGFSTISLAGNSVGYFSYSYIVGPVDLLINLQIGSAKN